MSEERTVYTTWNETDVTAFLDTITGPLQRRIAALEAERDALKAQVAALPRPVIMAFARIMEAKLATKDALGYPDWRDTDIGFSELEDEATELYHARSSGNLGDIAKEAADVALVAMMLWDSDCQEVEHDGRGRAKEGGAV